MLLKTKDLKEKSIQELNQDLEACRKELFTGRMGLHSRKLENSSSLRETRKSIARILTILNNKEQEA